MLVLTPSVNPTTREGEQPDPSRTQLQIRSLLRLTSSNRDRRAEKPLAVWECITSWYGEDFDGQPTANGETYDMYARRPLTRPSAGSIVRVVNTRNHRSQVVRINDRGPYVEGRELDVSYEVARSLDLTSAD